MKNRKSVLLPIITMMIFSLFVFSCASDSTPQHLGKWKNLSNKAHKESLIIFDELGNYMIQIGDEPVNIDANEINLSYAVDYNTDPIQLDIINKDTKVAAYKCLVRFPEKGLMQIQMPTGINANRPTDFSDERNQVNLKRQE